MSEKLLGGRLGITVSGLEMATMKKEKAEDFMRYRIDSGLRSQAPKCRLCPSVNVMKQARDFVKDQDRFVISCLESKAGHNMMFVCPDGERYQRRGENYALVEPFMAADAMSFFEPDAVTPEDFKREYLAYESNYNGDSSIPATYKFIPVQHFKEVPPKVKPKPPDQPTTVADVW